LCELRTDRTMHRAVSLERESDRATHRFKTGRRR
jgi:hypothetical protein